MLTTAVKRTRASASSSGSSAGDAELDPLLKDLSEKKQSFQRGLLSLASDLKYARTRLAEQEVCFAREIQIRKAAEEKAKIMEEKICQLQRVLDEKDGELQASTSSAEQCLKDLNDLRSQLAIAQAAADESAASAQSAEAQVLSLLKELDEKNSQLKEHEDRVSKLKKESDNLQKDLKAREFYQEQLKDEVTRIENDFMYVVSGGNLKNNAMTNNSFELSSRNFDIPNGYLSGKDEEVNRLRDEIRLLSAHWKHRTKDLQSQLDKHHRTDQELKKRVLKLEFCLQEARAQTRKLQRVGERRDNSIKELRDQLAMQQESEAGCAVKHNIWESSGFKFFASMSMLVLVAFARR